MNGWCNTCGGIKEVDRVVYRPRWIEKPPHYDFNFIRVSLCEEGHVLKQLCIECGKAKAEYDDYCVACAELVYDDWQLEDFRRDQVAKVKSLVRT